MPTYTFRNTKTDEVFDLVLRMNQREQYLKDNPHLVQTFTKPPGIGDPFTLGRVKAPEGWNEGLKSIARANPGNTIKYV